MTRSRASSTASATHPSAVSSTKIDRVGGIIARSPRSYAETPAAGGVHAARSVSLDRSLAVCPGGRAAR